VVEGGAGLTLIKIKELLGYGLSVRKIAKLLGYSNHITLNTYIKKRSLRHAGTDGESLTEFSGIWGYTPFKGNFSKEENKVPVLF